MRFQVELGQRLPILVVYGGRSIPCETTVLRAEGSELGVSIPMRHRVAIPVQTEHVVAMFPLADALYEVRCRVVGASADELSLELLGGDSIQRIQRRKFVRVPVEHPCTLRTEGANDPARPKALTCELANLGGGGCALRTSEAPSVGLRVALRCDLLNDQILPLRGRILRSTPVGDQHLLAIEFVNLTEVNQKELVQAVYGIQRNNTRFPGGRRHR